MPNSQTKSQIDVKNSWWWKSISALPLEKADRVKDALDGQTLAALEAGSLCIEYKDTQRVSPVEDASQLADFLGVSQVLEALLSSQFKIGTHKKTLSGVPIVESESVHSQWTLVLSSAQPEELHARVEGGGKGIVLTHKEWMQTTKSPSAPSEKDTSGLVGPWLRLGGSPLMFEASRMGEPVSAELKTAASAMEEQSQKGVIFESSSEGSAAPSALKWALQAHNQQHYFELLEETERHQLNVLGLIPKDLAHDLPELKSQAGRQKITKKLDLLTRQERYSPQSLASFEVAFQVLVLIKALRRRLKTLGLHPQVEVPSVPLEEKALRHQTIKERQETKKRQELRAEREALAYEDWTLVIDAQWFDPKGALWCASPKSEWVENGFCPHPASLMYALEYLFVHQKYAPPKSVKIVGLGVVESNPHEKASDWADPVASWLHIVSWCSWLWFWPPLGSIQHE